MKSEQMGHSMFELQLLFCGFTNLTLFIENSIIKVLKMHRLNLKSTWFIIIILKREFVEEQHLEFQKVHIYAHIIQHG